MHSLAAPRRFRNTAPRERKTLFHRGAAPCQPFPASAEIGWIPGKTAATSASASRDNVPNLRLAPVAQPPILARPSRSSLETSLRNALNATPARETEAVYRLFGKKYDSLGSLLDRVLDGIDVSDDVNQYVIVLCARQLCQEIRQDFPGFRQDHRAYVRVLDDRLTAGTALIRRRLVERNPAELSEFLDWFEPRFLKRAKPPEAEA